MQKNGEWEHCLKEMAEEKQKYINELYGLRMDINKKIEELGQQNATI